jgi:phage/plasmid-associated DNA primase
MYKKLVCEMGETNFGVLEKSSILKKLVGSDLIGYEMKGKTPFSSYNYAKMIIASNSLPSSNDTTDGFYRRWFIIDFPNEFPEGKDIVECIPEEEYNNLALKVTKILPLLLDRGSFTNQGSIPERRKRYQMASNPLPIFIDKYCERGSIDSFVSYGELYTRYLKFLIEHKRRRIKKKEFGEALEGEGFWVERTGKKVGIDDQGYAIQKNDTWVVGLKFSELSEVKHEISNSLLLYSNEVRKSCLTSLSALNNPLKWDNSVLVYMKCHIEGCTETECNYDIYSIPYCRKHFEEIAIR